MEPFTREEISKAIQKTKYRKAPDADNIPPEALKANPDTTASAIYRLIHEAWELRRIPKEWHNGYNVKLPKKGDFADCTNWRGIQLLSLFSKVYTRLILERIQKFS